MKKLTREYVINTINRNFANCDLSNLDLSNADLRHANFRGADLRNTSFRGTDLKGANFQNSILRDVDFRYSDLRYTDFRNADFQDADLYGANLDFSCFPLWCGSLKMKVDDRIMAQFLYHILSVCDASDEVSQDIKNLLMTEELKQIANSFIKRKDLEKL